jgi:hypothetical protein
MRPVGTHDRRTSQNPCRRENSKNTAAAWLASNAAKRDVALLKQSMINIPRSPQFALRDLQSLCDIRS